MQRCAPLAAPRTASCASAGLLNLPRGPASFFGLSSTSLYGVQFADQLQRSCFSPSYVSSGTSELASIMEEASPKPYHYLQLHGKTQASEDLFFPLQPLGGRNTCRRGKAAVILWAKLFHSITLQGWSLSEETQGKHVKPFGNRPAGVLLMENLQGHFTFWKDKMHNDSPRVMSYTTASVNAVEVAGVDWGSFISSTSTNRKVLCPYVGGKHAALALGPCVLKLT